MSVNIESSWKIALANEFEQPYFPIIKDFLQKEKEAGKIIYPPGSLIFNAFNSTPFDKVRVVIIGQDPYHKPGEAMGLSFSVAEGVKIPPSLRNIYKAIHIDVGIEMPKTGNLQVWADRGVFLLNAILTVEHTKPASHAKIGWEKFTDAVIKKLSDDREGIVFMLWGKFAQAKKSLIDTTKHHVLEAAHPSPLAGNAFVDGCRHFSQANAILTARGEEPIDWSIG